MTPRYPLELLQVPTPCPAKWAMMQGDDVKRYCGHCGRHVHNLSAMPRSEAELLVCSAAGDLCVQFDRTADGAVVTLDYAPRADTNRRYGMWGLLCAAAAVAISMVGMSTKTTTGRVAGMIAPSPAVTPTPPPVPVNAAGAGEAKNEAATDTP